MPYSIFQLYEGESCQVAEISAELFKRGCKKYHLDEKKQIILSNFKIFLSQTSKNIFIKSAGVSWSW